MFRVETRHSVAGHSVAGTQSRPAMPVHSVAGHDIPRSTATRGARPLAGHSLARRPVSVDVDEDDSVGELLQLILHKLYCLTRDVDPME